MSHLFVGLSARSTSLISPWNGAGAGGAEYWARTTPAAPRMAQLISAPRIYGVLFVINVWVCEIATACGVRRQAERDAALDSRQKQRHAPLAAALHILNHL